MQASTNHGFQNIDLSLQHKYMKKISLLFVLLIIGISLSYAQVRLAAIYGDHMVLQQQAKVCIWGWANPLQEIVVKASWDGVEAKTKADHNARWKTYLTTPGAGGPYTISIKSNNEIILNDILIGEVWLCSGQSNMERPLSAAAEGPAEVPNANYPNLRLFYINKSSSKFPQEKGEGRWSICTPEAAQWFSAVGYFFGNKIHRDLKIPIGLISACWGGTPAEPWTPDSLIMANPELLSASKKIFYEEYWGPKKPGYIFNSMIHPITPFQIAGAIWYQGEGNASVPSTYKLLMETMIKGWRIAFDKEFPFYYVQIAPFAQYAEIEKGILIREQQAKMLSIPRTGMIVISDLVDDVNDIHPRYKRPVGERLANYALAETYGRTGFAYKSPLYRSMSIEKGKIIISLDNCPNGLIAKNGEPTEFMIAGKDRKFVPAVAKIKGSTVIVSNKEVKNPVAVRFGWTNGSIPNLFSKEGLPASCFRTDDWSAE